MTQSRWNLKDPYGKPLAGMLGAPSRSVLLGAAISNSKFPNTSTQQIRFKPSPEYVLNYFKNFSMTKENFK